MDNWWWSAHTHSKYSMTDALPAVWDPTKSGIDMVSRAAHLGYPALGLTDHGNMAGAVALYKGCRARGIEPLPGMEAYFTFNPREGKRPKTFHMTVWALSGDGYRNLVALNNAAMKAFYYKPLVTVDYLADASENGKLDGLAIGTGCVSGWGPSILREPTGNITNVIAMFQAWFGGRVYMELMDHNLKFEGHSDAVLNKHLMALADKMGMPCLLTQDSHYIHPFDRNDHDTYKRLFSWKDDPDDAVFGGTWGYHMTTQDEMEGRIDPAVLEAGKVGLADLLGQAKVVIPELDTFTFRVPKVTITDPPEDEFIVTLRHKGEERHGGRPPEKYVDRANQESRIIIDYGFVDYMMLVSLLCDWMREEGILYNTRGSACGSLVAYYLGITTVDPIKHNIPFDRFISADRGKPPDIDLDVADDDRPRVLEKLSRMFHMVHISNWIEAKLDEKEAGKGSLVVKWKMGQRKRGESIVPNEDEMKALQSLAKHAPYTHIGVHPAGVILANDPSDLDDLPLMRVSGDQMLLSAYDMKGVEETGLLKLDVLGLKTLRAIRIARDLSGVALEDIPLNDKEVYKRIRQDTEGLFQLQGFTGAKVINRLKPTKLQDIVAAVALGRPAIMGASLDDFVDRKHRRKPIPKQHPIIMEATKDTYGVMLFQEQVVDVLRGLGFTPEELAQALKAIKASNAKTANAAKVLEGLKSRVQAEADRVGMSERDKEWLADAFVKFSGYSFNKAHSVSYGLMAYQSAWYITYYPVAYYTGLLTAYTGDQAKELRYKKAARADGVKVYRPHINKSKEGYTADMNAGAIRYGFEAVSGIGEKAAAELVKGQPYSSLSDLAAKVDARKVTGAKGLREGHHPEACGGVVKALFEIGALEGLE